MKDLQNRNDIILLLQSFYAKAFADPLIGHFFTEIVPLDLDTHIPLIADFWESVVFGKRGYQKNVMEVHRHINHLSTIKDQHLDRWVEHFHQQADALFSGPNTTLIKQRAASIATLMKIKLQQDDNI